MSMFWAFKLNFDVAILAFWALFKKKLGNILFNIWSQWLRGLWLEQMLLVQKLRHHQSGITVTGGIAAKKTKKHLRVTE